MRIPKSPYHHVSNELLYALLTGGDCIGYDELPVDSLTAKSLTVPNDAQYALIVVEADASAADKEKVVRFKEFDTTANPPTESQGIPLGDLGIYEVKGIQNLTNFKITGIEPGKVHVLRIQYFG